MVPTYSDLVDKQGILLTLVSHRLSIKLEVQNVGTTKLKRNLTFTKEITNMI